jgi:polysaccharide deacetylase family protein (PEP-CTERM system associated)
MLNAFTVDLEDWFCSHNLAASCPYVAWPLLESRVEASTRRLLALLSDHGVRATFFVLGWIAERHPGLVADIAARGHEIASHGYAHRPLTELRPEEFEADLRRSVDAIGAACGRRPLGYRAPAFSIVRQTLWAIDILQRNGFSYDSSVYPIGIHPDYGLAAAPLLPFRHPNGLPEIPLSVAELGFFRFHAPCGGGGYLRQLPYGVFSHLVRRCQRQGRPLNFYIHPWELDPAQPRARLSPVRRWRHYGNLSTVETKLQRLLTDFRFGTMAEAFLTRIPNLQPVHADLP